MPDARALEKRMATISDLGSKTDQNHDCTGSRPPAGPRASLRNSASGAPSISSSGGSTANFSAASENVLVVTKKPLWLLVWWIVPRNFWSIGEPTMPLWNLH